MLGNQDVREEGKVRRLIVDPSALRYINQIKEMVKGEYELFVPVELIPSFDDLENEELLEVLKYWNGYRTSNRSLKKMKETILVEKSVKGFSSADFTFQEKSDAIFKELLKAVWWGPRKPNLKDKVARIVAKIVAFARQSGASIISLSAKLGGLLSATSVSIFNLSKSVVEQLKKLPQWLDEFKKNRKIRKKKRYLLYVGSLTLQAISVLLSFGNVESNLVIFGATTVAFDMDP